METRFNTKIFGDSGSRIVVAYGLNKMYCSNCTRILQDKEYVYTCEDVYGSAADDHELRVLNCDNCERKKETECVNVRYDSRKAYHFHALAQLRICPLSVDLKEFVKGIK